MYDKLSIMVKELEQHLYNTVWSSIERPCKYISILLRKLELDSARILHYMETGNTTNLGVIFASSEIKTILGDLQEADFAPMGSNDAKRVLAIAERIVEELDSVAKKMSKNSGEERAWQAKYNIKKLNEKMDNINRRVFLAPRELFLRPGPEHYKILQNIEYLLFDVLDRLKKNSINQSDIVAAAGEIRGLAREIGRMRDYDDDRGTNYMATDAFNEIADILDDVVYDMRIIATSENVEENRDENNNYSFMSSQKDTLKKMIFLERTQAKDLNAEYRATILESVLKMLYENENN